MSEKLVRPEVRMDDLTRAVIEQVRAVVESYTSSSDAVTVWQNVPLKPRLPFWELTTRVTEPTPITEQTTRRTVVANENQVGFGQAPLFKFSVRYNFNPIQPGNDALAIISLPGEPKKDGRPSRRDYEIIQTEDSQEFDVWLFPAYLDEGIQSYDEFKKEELKDEFVAEGLREGYSKEQLTDAEDRQISFDDYTENLVRKWYDEYLDDIVETDFGGSFALSVAQKHDLLEEMKAYINQD